MKQVTILLSLLLLLGLSACAEKPADTAGADGTDSGAVSSEPAGENGTANAHNLIGSLAGSGDVVSIEERLFVAQTNDIYINTDDYFGKTIQYEGMFKTSYWPETDTTYHYVIRYGPGCCGYDNECGFEVRWDGEGEWPEEDAWVAASGVLEAYEEDGWEYLRLVLDSLTVLDERGEEYVST